MVGHEVSVVPVTLLNILHDLYQFAVLGTRSTHQFAVIIFLLNCTYLFFIAAHIFEFELSNRLHKYTACS